MKSNRLVSAARWSVLGIAMAFTGCSEKDPAPNNGGNTQDGGTNAEAPGPGTVTGIALDTQGRPIPDVKVHLAPALNQGTGVTGRTGADGRYRFEGLPTTAYYARAWAKVKFNNQEFCLRLGMPERAHYDAFSPSAGAVRNFRWQLTGPIEGFEGQYFGATTYLAFRGNYDDSTMELTFTPTSPLIDGSPASAFKRTVDVSTNTLEDIPVANYTVTGVITRGGEQRPLHIGLEPADSYEEQTESAQLVFKPGGNPCSSLASGVDDTTLLINSPFE